MLELLEKLEIIVHAPVSDLASSGTEQTDQLKVITGKCLQIDCFQVTALTEVHSIDEHSFVLFTLQSTSLQLRGRTAPTCSCGHQLASTQLRNTVLTHSSLQSGFPYIVELRDECKNHMRAQTQQLHFHPKWVKHAMPYAHRKSSDRPRREKAEQRRKRVTSRRGGK